MKDVYRGKDETPRGYDLPSSRQNINFLRTAEAAAPLRCSQNCVSSNSSSASSCLSWASAKISQRDENRLMSFGANRRSPAPPPPLPPQQQWQQNKENEETSLPSSLSSSCLTPVSHLPSSVNLWKQADYRKRHAVEGANRSKRQFTDEDDDGFHPGGPQEVLRLSKAFHHRISASRPGSLHSTAHSEEGTIGSRSVHGRFANVETARTANSPSFSYHEYKANRYWNSPNSMGAKSSSEENMCAQPCRRNRHSCEQRSNTESASGSPNLIKQDSISNLNPGSRLHSAGLFCHPCIETPSYRPNFKENNLLKSSYDRSGMHLMSDSVLIDELVSPVSEKEGGELVFQSLAWSKGDALSHHGGRKTMQILRQEIQKRCLKSELEGRLKLIKNSKAQVEDSSRKGLPGGRTELIARLENIRMESKKQKDRAREVVEKNSASLPLKEVSSCRKFEDYYHSEQRMVGKEDMEMVELKQALVESLKQVKLVEEQRDALVRRCQNQEGENMELQKMVSTLRQTSEAENEAYPYARLEGKSEQIIKLQTETLRLRGVEVELLKGEVLRLKKENKNLAGRLKHATSKGGTVRMLRVDEEKTGRTDAPEESKCLALKLQDALRKMKENKVQLSDLEPQTAKPLLKEHQCDVQQFVRQTDELKKNTHGFIGDKVNMLHGHPCSEFESQLENPFTQAKELVDFDGFHPNFKDETLFCKLLREKKVELEQLQANYLNVVHDRDWLQMEVHSMQTALSSSNHRVRELEQQLLDREEETRGLLREMKNKSRQLMQLQEQVERVKTEMGREADERSKEVLKLSAEVEALKKKVEKLDEDVMLKDGQISILRSAFNDTDE